jgi:hypothetical protein
MKSRLLIILLIVGLNVFAQVPNTTTFTLQDVVDEVNPTTNDLQDCFSDAIADYFNPTYEGSKNSLLNFRDYGSHNATADLSGAYLVWELDAITSGVVQDATANNNDGTLNGTSWTVTASGKINSALIPTSDSDEINAPTDETDVTSISISSWWYGNASNLTGEQGAIWTSPPISAYSLRLIVIENSASIGFNLIKIIDNTNGFYSATIPSSTFQFADYEWVNIIVVRSLSAIKVYANGDLIHSVTRTNGTLANRRFSIAGRGTTGAVGRFDQLAIWHRELDSVSVSYLYNSGNGRAYINW